MSKFKKKDSVLMDFVSDGCTIPDKYTPVKYHECCADHDYAYWRGGSIGDKIQADTQLVNCIRSRGAGLLTAGEWQLMLGLFGMVRWNVKWVPRRPNVPLSESERAQVSQKSKNIPLTIPQVSSTKPLKTCPENIQLTLKQKTKLKKESALTCYKLANFESDDPTKSTMIFSPSCEGGYFIHRTNNINKDSILNDEVLDGYGICADLMLNQMQASNPKIKYIQRTNYNPADVVK